jgi:hypothetical protein
MHRHRASRALVSIINRQYISVVAANISFFGVATGSEARADE